MSRCSASPSPSLVPLPLETGAQVQGFSPTALEFTAETDSALEGDGFELLVPRQSPAWTSGSPFISRRYLQARTPPPDADEAVCDHCGLRVRRTSAGSARRAGWPYVANSA